MRWMTDAQRDRLVVLLLFFAAFVFAGVSARAEKVADLKPTEYVNDFAGVLSPETVHSLDMLCGQVDHRANAQLAVITIHTTGGEDIDQFTTELEDRWKVGRKGSDRAVLVLLAVDDHHYRIEVGYGLEPILNDAKVGDIGRAMVPALKQGDYNTALTQTTTALAQDIAADANVQLDPQWQVHGQRRNAASAPLTARQVISAIVVVLFILWFLTRIGGGGLVGFLLGNLLGGGFGGGRGRGGWGGGGGFGGGDGGGWGGGGGDGFGGFGGGSSGGGGASGSW